MLRWTPRLVPLANYGPRYRVALRPLLTECFGERDFDTELFDRQGLLTAFVVPSGGGQFVAHAALFTGEGNRTGVLYPCVDPDVRRTGIGSLVLQACLIHNALAPAGAELVGCDGPPNFLKVNGFRNLG